MNKGPLSIKRGKTPKDWVTFDPRMTKDKHGMNLHIESGNKESYYGFLQLIAGWALGEIEKIEEPTSEHLS